MVAFRFADIAIFEKNKKNKNKKTVTGLIKTHTTATEPCTECVVVS